MRVLCRSNSGRNLSAKHSEVGYTSSSQFDLEVTREYIVYAMSLSRGLLSYLIVGQGGWPHWYPSELFTLTRTDLPPDWHFAYFKEDEGFVVNAIWGYEELINNDDHFDSLSNMETRAMAVFLERKEQIDKVS